MNNNLSSAGTWSPFTPWTRGWRLVALTALVASLGALFLVTRHEGDVDSIRLLIRLTARGSLALFCLAFTATAANQLWPNAWTRWQRANRRYLGLSFAASHFIPAKRELTLALGYLRLSGANALQSKSISRVMIAPMIFATLWLGGCANLSNHSSGFLESYEHLKPDPKDSHRLVYERADWKTSDYTSVLIEPAVVRLTAVDQKKITAQEMADLADYNDKSLRKAFAKEWKIVTAAEPGTLRVRSAITGVDPSNPALNVVTSLVVCPVDNGGVSVEYEVRDATSGEQLVALAGFTNATPLEGLWAFTRFGQAHYAINHWSVELRKMVHPAVTKIAAK